MKANNNLPQNPFLNNVQITRDAKTTITRVIIPKGTIGKIIEYHNSNGNSRILVDFGLPSVIILPLYSDFIEVCNA